MAEPLGDEHVHEEALPRLVEPYTDQRAFYSCRMDRRTSFDGRSVPAGSGADPRVAVVVLAGGSGLRVGGDRNKAYLPLGDHTAVGLSLQAMERATAPWLCRLILVIRNDDGELARQTLDDELPRPLVPVELVTGGSTRHGSEERALRHLADAVAAAEIDLVLIHDAARPFGSPALVGALVRAAAKYGGAVPGLGTGAEPAHRWHQYIS